MQRGEIWTVQPHERPKSRPAVIVSVNAWNKFALDVILVPLTTHPGPSRPPVTREKLKKPSFAKCGSVSAISKERLKRRVGTVSEREMRGIEREVRRILGL